MIRYTDPSAAIAASIFLFSSGCGTLANLNGQSFPLMGGVESTRPFGGDVATLPITWVTTKGTKSTKESESQTPDPTFQ